MWRAHLGRKASVRLRNPGDPAHPFTEAIGVVKAVVTDEASGEAIVTVVTRRGQERAAPVADVLAAKLF